MNRYWKRHTLDSKENQECNLRSKIWWFTEFCNSHYVSHFAAFFIVTRTKISIANSCLNFVINQYQKEKKERILFFFWLFFFIHSKGFFLKDKLNVLIHFRKKRTIKFFISSLNQTFKIEKLIRSTGVINIKKKLFRTNPKQIFFMFFVLMILPQVHLRKPCYDFSFL